MLGVERKLTVSYVARSSSPFGYSPVSPGGYNPTSPGGMARSPAGYAPQSPVSTLSADTVGELALTAASCTVDRSQLGWRFTVLLADFADDQLQPQLTVVLVSFSLSGFGDTELILHLASFRPSSPSFS